MEEQKAKGGRRPGAGRKPTGRKNTSRMVTLPEPLWVRLDELAGERMLPRSTLIREAVEKYLK